MRHGKREQHYKFPRHLLVKTRSGVSAGFQRRTTMVRLWRVCSKRRFCPQDSQTTILASTKRKRIRAAYCTPCSMRCCLQLYKGGMAFGSRQAYASNGLMSVHASKPSKKQDRNVPIPFSRLKHFGVVFLGLAMSCRIPESPTKRVAGLRSESYEYSSIQGVPWDPEGKARCRAGVFASAISGRSCCSCAIKAAQASLQSWS